MIRRRSGMLSMTLAAGLVTAMGAGCGDSGTTTTPTPAAEQTFDYVLNALNIDANTDPASAHTGFNVDNRFSGSNMSSLQDADCNHIDFFSSLDSDQNQGTCPGTSCRGGVDNQLPELATAIQTAAGMDVRQAIAGQITSGKLILLMRVSGVNGTPAPGFNDPSVVVRIYIGHPNVPAAQCSTLFAGGTSFAVDTNSLMAGSTNLNNALFQFNGSIVNGRLQVTPGMGTNSVLPIPLPEIQGLRLTLNVNNPQIRMTLTADRGTNGNLGGFLLRSEVVTAICNGFAQFCEVARSLVDGLVDVQTGTPAGCAMPNGGISLGLGLTAVRATIAATPVTGAQPGMCGTN